MADDRERELMISREKARALGLSAVEFIKRGAITRRDGSQLDWRREVESAVVAKRSIPPNATLPAPPPARFSETRVQVSNETTFGAAWRLIQASRRPLALNFASGVHPGGGFLRGARAQEEALCRYSALYATLRDDPMYAAHALRPRPDSSDWVIYSPDVPVFRDDAGDELAETWPLSFLTCAAPVAMRVGQPESGDLLRARIHRVLAVAQAFGHSALVLGAWGCGAFGNDPVRTARDFRAALEGPFLGAFSEVIFAVANWSPERRILGPFRDAFAA